MVNNTVYYRKRCGLRRPEVEEKTGILRATLACYENGHNVPNVEYAIKLAKCYGTTVEDMFCKVISKKEKERVDLDYYERTGYNT